MKIDCLSCTQKPVGCDDCVVTLLMSLPAPDSVLLAEETQALEALAKAGLVPSLRLVEGPRTAAG